MPNMLSNVLSFARNARIISTQSKKLDSAGIRLIQSQKITEFLEHAGVTFDAPSTEDVFKHAPCVFVGNHNSHLDALLICATFKGDVRFLTKASLFKSPFLGKVLKVAGHIPVFRGRDAHKKNAAQRLEISKLIESGSSLFFFPEGTRSTTGALGQFKLGAFYFALQNNVPIVPIIIRGSFDLMPKDSFNTKSGHCTVEALAPIYPPTNGTAESERESAEKLAQITHDVMSAQLSMGSSSIKKASEPIA